MEVESLDIPALEPEIAEKVYRLFILMKIKSRLFDRFVRQRVSVLQNQLRDLGAR